MKHYSSIFISDLHIFNRGFKAEYLNDFLANVTCDKLYIDGDGLDFYCIDGKRAIWDKTTIRTLTHLWEMTKKGTKIFYALGNHDEALYPFIPLELENVTINDAFEHITSKGKRYLVIHGQQFDICIGRMKWLSKVGAVLYGHLLTLNHLLHKIRVKTGYKKYWSLSKFLKHKAKQAVSFIQDFKLAAVKMAKDYGYDGIIVGHIHREEDCMIDGIHYLNCGDWVESISCVVEYEDGQLEVLHAHEIMGFWEES